MTSTLLEKRRPAQSPELDPSTLSNYKKFTVHKTDIFFKVNWTKKILTGLVNYNLEVNDISTSDIVLDTSYLNVANIKFNGEEIRNYNIAARNGPLGSALTIPIKATNGKSDLTIEFSTTDECTGLQWLNPEQTSDGTAPYLFSQCQAIHARSLFPCFDTPSVKVPYSMHIESIYPTLSSGNPVKTNESTLPSGFFSTDDPKQKIYSFEQEIPIPSYLFSIASGNIKSAEIGPRSLVYTEPGELDDCKYEFEADTENFIQAAEKIVFPYSWKTYNVLVLPKSFPYGGMENPNHTFATPTLIDGKRQNVDVIAHELAHSWSGNLISNCSWNHFYLNEGWTVYLERRIIGAVHGEAHRHFSAIIGWKDLEESIKSMGDDAAAYSKLIVDLSGGKDPDDAFSTVPYEKGFNLLFHLENLVGGKEVFDPFIPYYFNKFKCKSLDSYQFYDTIYEFFHDKKDLLDTVDWDAWFFTPGLPPKPKFDTSIADACYSLASKWIEALSAGGDYSAFNKDDIASWTSTQSFVFLDAVADGIEKLDVEVSQVAKAASALDSAYSLSSSSNAEVISRWYRLVVAAQLKSEYEPLANWLGTVGRMKFVRPGFRRLNSVDRELALATFEKNKTFYHPICRAMVTKDLGL
ncbi:Lap2p [Sugiyamaella lignohabitans]|uniref:Leukotriene A(4) hydrolase n=1 Tax=Sugiyamaella lignohabitans TaxID=796027 RepID=A0A167FB00_9ASCO|nr:Lap2p [Sugiyamaella lignohabitans]ANB15053.1 Lap2p [Sugiyamaella lignohabitans]